MTNQASSFRSIMMRPVHLGSDAVLILARAHLLRCLDYHRPYHHDTIIIVIIIIIITTFHHWLSPHALQLPAPLSSQHNNASYSSRVIKSMNDTASGEATGRKLGS